LGNPSTGAGAAPEPAMRARFARGGWLADAPSFWSMTDDTKQKRPALIFYRPPADLAEELRRRVEASGLPVNAYITKALFDLVIPRGTRRPPCFPAPSAEHAADDVALGMAG